MWNTHCPGHVSVTPARNGKTSYVLNRGVDTDRLPGRLGVVDTDREVCMTNRNDLEASGIDVDVGVDGVDVDGVVVDVSHWDSRFDKKCGVGWGKLRGLLPAL